MNTKPFSLFKSRRAVAVKRREIMNLISIETVIGQRFLCGVNRGIMA
jgi:hypothetical protein